MSVFLFRLWYFYSLCQIISVNTFRAEPDVKPRLNEMNENDRDFLKQFSRERCKRSESSHAERKQDLRLGSRPSSSQREL